MDLVKPNKLKKGDTIALISPSAGLAGIYPHVIDRAVTFLENQGYKVKEYPTTRSNNGYQSAPPKERARDIMSAFNDSEVKAIICTLGGEVVNQTLEYLNFKKIRQNAKIFMGYSDISILHYAFLTQSNILTFYGPAVMTQFGESPKPLEYTVKYFNKAVTQTKPIGIVKPSKRWTDEIALWDNPNSIKQRKLTNNHQGYNWLRTGSAEGNLLGGCLPSILHLKGTK